MERPLSDLNEILRAGEEPVHAVPDGAAVDKDVEWLDPQADEGDRASSSDECERIAVARFPNVEGQAARLCIIADSDERPDTLAVEKVDLLVSLGDLSNETLEWYRDRLGRPPTVAVRGNRDSTWPFPDGVEDLHDRLIRLGGLRLYGFRGSVRYKPRMHHGFTQEEVERRVTYAPPCDVFVAHSPPRHVHDDSDDPARVGFEALGDYMRRHQPPVLLHGHPVQSPETLVGTTWVLGTCGHRFLDVPLPHAM